MDLVGAAKIEAVVRAAIAILVAVAADGCTLAAAKPSTLVLFVFVLFLVVVLVGVALLLIALSRSSLQTVARTFGGGVIGSHPGEHAAEWQRRYQSDDPTPAPDLPEHAGEGIKPFRIHRVPPCLTAPYRVAGRTSHTAMTLS
jgi:hypothetical protein